MYLYHTNNLYFDQLLSARPFFFGVNVNSQFLVFIAIGQIVDHYC